MCTNKHSINVYMINWGIEVALCCPREDYHTPLETSLQAESNGV